MTAPKKPVTRDKVIGLLNTYATLTANAVADRAGCKHETAKRLLIELENDGLVYSRKEGNRVYYTSFPMEKNGDRRKVHPAPKKVEIKTDPYAHPSPTPLRAATRLQVIPVRGFVCHPAINGDEVGREFVRSHFSGEYQVSIKQIGSLKTCDALPDTETRVYWKKTGLSTNVSCNGEIYFKDNPKPVRIRTVSTASGDFKILSVWIQPRYVYYIGETETAQAEFIQQVADVTAVLNRLGWVFGSEITAKGQQHHAINDKVLGALVSHYNEYDDDPVHFDASHGTPEVEVYGNDNPETIEMLVRLPEIIQSYGVAIRELKNLYGQIVETAGLQAQAFEKLMRSQSFLIQSLSAVPQPPQDGEPKPLDPLDGGVMYG